jgi:hypothetical protein
LRFWKKASFGFGGGFFFVRSRGALRCVALNTFGLEALLWNGAGLTFFAAAKKVSKESSFFRQQS